MLHPPNAIHKHTHAWHVRINTVIVRHEVHAHGCKLRIVSVAISNQAHSSYRSMTTSRQALYYASSTRLHAQTRNNLTVPTHNVHAAAPRSRSYNYIFKVLFTAPSWYVFSIGFGHVSIF